MQVKVTISVDVPGLDCAIKSAMASKSVSYKTLGEQAGVTASACWQIANGESKAAKLETVWRIAKALDLDLSAQFQSALTEQTQIWSDRNEV